MTTDLLRQKIVEIREQLDDLEAMLALYVPAPEKKQELDFDEIYTLYPRKRGKELGLKRCRSKIKTLAAWADLRIAVENYSKSVEGKDPQYVMHFSTFMNCWREWINPEPESDSPKLTPRARQSGEHFQDQAERIARGEL